MSFDTTPLETGGGGTYAQAGWVFRASDTGTGYAWLLGNYPYPGAGAGSLTRVVFDGGQVVSSAVVPLPFAVVAGDAYSVATTVSGSTITTTINGTTVDTTTDSRFTAGRVGFRENGSESALFANLRVTAPDGSVLLADSFDGDLAAWDRPAPVVTGTSITATSCGGQPDNVAVLAGPDGPSYLYASDRWVNGAHNQSLATQDWEPLRFTANGAIEPLTCAPTVTVPLAGAARPVTGTRPGVESAGDDGFHSYCDIGGAIERAQVFTVHRAGLLTAVQDTTFQSGSPNQPLTLRVAPVGPDGTPTATTLASATIPAARTSWAPAWATLATRLPVRPGERLALVISSPLTSGCYGLAYSDANPYPAGGEYYSRDVGTTWTAEAGRDLHFRAITGA